MEHNKLLETVLHLTKKHCITAYEIADNTPLNASGVHRILTNQTKNPRKKTLNIILDYIEQRITGANLNNSHIDQILQTPGPEVSINNETLKAIKELQNKLTNNQNLIADGVAQCLVNSELIKEETIGLKIDRLEVKNGLAALQTALGKINL